MKKTALLFLSVFLVVSNNARGDIMDMFLGLGSYTAFPGKIQTDDSGGTNGKFDLNPYVQGGLEYRVYENWSLIGELGLVKPGSGRDPEISKMTYFTILSGAYSYMDWVFRLGAGLSMTRISSNGGTQTLDNGTTTTDFPMPDGASVSRNVISTLGVEYYFQQEMSTRLEGQFFNLASSDARNFSYTLSFSYHFGNIFDAENTRKSK